jgi:hypothetical protein
MIVIGAVLLGAGRALAANGYTLVAWTVDSGGGTLTGGAYSLSATVGQPDAGVLKGGVYMLLDGFWGGDVSGERQTEAVLYLPAVTSGTVTQSQGVPPE